MKKLVQPFANENKGYLTMVEQAHGNRIEKTYIATELGKTAFLEWLSS